MMFCLSFTFLNIFWISLNVQRTLANVKAPDANTDASQVLTDHSVSVKRAVSPMGRIALVRFLFCNLNLNVF